MSIEVAINNLKKNLITPEKKVINEEIQSYTIKTVPNFCVIKKNRTIHSIIYNRS